MSDLDRRLATYGSDLSRWPDGASAAREALLSDPEFRHSWELERKLDRALHADRDAIDAEIVRSGALARLGHLSTHGPAASFLAGIPWRRVAAGVLVAGMLGSALDLMLPEPTPEPVDLALVDPLGGFDSAGAR